MLYSTRCKTCDRALSGMKPDLTCHYCNRQSRGERSAKASVRQRIASRREAEKRLIAWIAGFRIPSEQGLGDTAERLLTAAKDRGKTELASIIKNLLQACDCQKELRQAAWNERHPY